MDREAVNSVLRGQEIGYAEKIAAERVGGQQGGK